MEKLVIISHTPHFIKDNQVVGWAATVKEIDALSHLFDQVIHVAPLHADEKPHAGVAPYESSKVQLRAVGPSGGNTIKEKFRILFSIPEYLKVIRSEVRDAKVVHVRCPANISLLAIVFLAFIREPGIRWFKYAGNWKPENALEPLSYRFQRWFLRRGFHRGVVTVNGSWPNQPEFIHPFHNPCLTAEELVRAKEIVLTKRLTDPIRLVFAGNVQESKGVGRCIKILNILRKNSVPASLDIVGDGPERETFENLAETLSVADAVRFHGWLPRTQLPSIYSQGHVLLFPSASEGWPKVLSEAMAYGVVPVASKVSSIPYYLGMYQCGVAINTQDLEGFATAIIDYRNDPEKWREHSLNGMKAAHFFSYENYLTKVAELLQLNQRNPLLSVTE
jgi:glycosyltransferase involved in cell wall biosynthesis